MRKSIPIASESVRHEINIALRKKVRRVTQDILIPLIALQDHISTVRRKLENALTIRIAAPMALLFHYDESTDSRIHWD